ncbi:MAG: ABC transporter substrate-binding protein, partial [Acidimicrobiales bacterium]
SWGGASGASTTPSLASCKASMPGEEYVKGTLTAATDNPVYSPWFINNKPSNGKGYESALVYALAKVLGIPASHVKWAYEPFDSSYTPGTKHFDFDINEISYTAARAKAVTFSASYYDVNQSIVALKTDKIVKDHTPAELKNYLFGDQIGTTSLAYINDYIKPTRSPRVYTTLDQAVEALQLGQIDAIVIDTPTGQYMASSQIVNSKNKLVATQVGQFPSVGEHYGLLFAKGNPLVGCINAGLAALKSDGTLAALQKKWLGIYTSVPLIEP